MSSDSPATPPDSALTHQVAVEWLLGANLVLAPLFRSGQPAPAVLGLEVLSITLLVLVG